MDSQKISRLLMIYTTFEYNIIVQACFSGKILQLNKEIENCNCLAVNFFPISTRNKNKVG